MRVLQSLTQSKSSVIHPQEINLKNSVDSPRGLFVVQQLKWLTHPSASAKQCVALNLLLKPTKTQEMLFSTQYVKPCTQDLVLNGTAIVLGDKSNL